MFSLLSQLLHGLLAPEAPSREGAAGEEGGGKWRAFGRRHALSIGMACALATGAGEIGLAAVLCAVCLFSESRLALAFAVAGVL